MVIQYQEVSAPPAFPTHEEFQHEVTELVKEWQIRLRLLDWDILLRFPAEKIKMFATSYTNPHYKSAEIVFRHPMHHGNQLDFAAASDTEVTVVHELLHVSHANMPDKADRLLMANPQWEAFIETTAQALVAAKRGVLRIGAPCPSIAMSVQPVM
jgi:hypothetical protein